MSITSVLTSALLWSVVTMGVVECFTTATPSFYRQSKTSNVPTLVEGSTLLSSQAMAEPIYNHHNVVTSKRYSSYTADGTMPPSFEDRMRNLVLRRGKTKSPTKQRSKSRRHSLRPSNVEEVLTLGEFKTAVADEKDRLVVVRFYATWCNACRAVAPAFYRLAKEFEKEVKFVEVPITDQNANVHQGLGVPSIPFGHIYHPQGGLVEEHRVLRKQVPQFVQILRSYVKGECELPQDDDDFCSNPYGESDE